MSQIPSVGKGFVNDGMSNSVKDALNEIASASNQ